MKVFFWGRFYGLQEETVLTDAVDFFSREVNPV